MSEIKLVKPDKLKNLDEYAVSLLTSMFSLKTLDAYHMAAFNLGLLEEDEIKNIESINHAITSLLMLYKFQMENVLERTSITEEEILLELRKIMPEVDIPRKRKNVRKAKKNEIQEV